MNNFDAPGAPQDKEKPADSLRQESQSAGIEQLPSRLHRYAVACGRSRDMEQYLRTLVFDESLKPREQVTAHQAASKLCSCGNWLTFRHYWKIDQVKLIAGQFCQLTKLCPFCAIRRGARNMGVYLERYQFLRGQNPRLKAFLVTLTVRNGEDLLERMNHLKSCYKRLIDGRRQAKSGNGRGNNPFAGVCGGIAAYEVTNQGKGWHPHIHTIILAEQAPDQDKLSQYWHKTSGDSFIVDVRPVDESAPEKAFCEIFKYAMKFQSMTFSDNWRAHLDLKGFRLLKSFGLFYGVKLPPDLTDDLLQDQPYVDLFFRYLEKSKTYTYDEKFRPPPRRGLGRGGSSTRSVWPRVPGLKR